LQRNGPACRLTIYGYWNEGGVDNIVSMLLYICNTFFQDTGAAPAEVQTTPQTGCLHPAASQYFESPAEYLTWYNKQGPLRNTAAPVVALLVYRKHVITKQDYIAELVTELEGQGLLPVPIFINGVEAHTVVRDLLTSADEAAALAAGAPRPQGLKRNAVQVCGHDLLFRNTMFACVFQLDRLLWLYAWCLCVTQAWTPRGPQTSEQLHTSPLSLQCLQAFIAACIACRWTLW
jgi:CobN/Magnesium Chelatase